MKNSEHRHIHQHVHCSAATRCFRAAAAAVCLVLVGCSGESGPQQGSPEWYRDAAVANISIGDYAKADEQIEAVAKSDSELAAKAVLWRAALLAGLTTGYDTLADVYVEGREANEKQSAEFQSVISAYRRETRQNAIALAESAGAVKKAIAGQDMVVLEFPLPDGSGAESPILPTVRTGRLPLSEGAQAERATLETLTLTRSILLAAAALSGSGDDVQKLRSAFETGSASVSHSDFETALARHLLDSSVMFDREGLNEPKIRTSIFEIAQAWAEPYLENADYEEWAEAFKFDVTNEERDMEGKRRIKKD